MLVVKSCVELLRSCGINNLVAVSDNPAFCLDYKLPTTLNIRTCDRWQFANKLEDLDFADDVALVAGRIVDMQTEVENLYINGKKTGLKINLGKTVVMKWNVNPEIKIQLEGRGIEEVVKFV